MSNSGKKDNGKFANIPGVVHPIRDASEDEEISPTRIAIRNRRRYTDKKLWGDLEEGGRKEEKRAKSVEDIINSSVDPNEIARAMFVALVDYKYNFVAKDVVSMFFERSWFAAELIEAFNASAYDLVPKASAALSPDPSSNDEPELWNDRPAEDRGMSTAGSPALQDITSEQMQTYHIVAAAISRAHRAKLTPEQAAHESKQGAKRSAAFRERMTPEQRAARSQREAERLRQKRALEKAPKP